MKKSIFTLVVYVLSICAVYAGLPKVASLKPGEMLSVEMRLYGYTITGADFLFTSEKVVVTPLNKMAGELVLTATEKAKVDAFLELVQRAKSRIPGGEGFDYSIIHFKDQKQTGVWKIQIYDVLDSEKATLSLYELKSRVEKQQEQKVEQGAVGDGGKPAK